MSCLPISWPLWSHHLGLHMKGKCFKEIAYKNGGGRERERSWHTRGAPWGMILKARSNSCSGDQYVELRFPAPTALAKVTGLCPHALSHICFGVGRRGFPSPRPLSSDQLSLTNLQGSASSKRDYTLITTREPQAIADLAGLCPAPQHMKWWWGEAFVTEYWISSLTSYGPSHFHTGISLPPPPSLQEALVSSMEVTAEPWDLSARWWYR